MKSARSSISTAVLAASCLLLLDQITKRWAVSALESGRCTPDTCVDLFWTLRLHLAFNSGASFSTGESLGPLFGVFALVMTGVLFKMAYEAQRPVRSVLLGLISGGALGNLVDRFVRAEDGFLSGSVVDFIDPQWWPIFNVADMGIVGGIIALIGLTVWDERRAENSDQPHSAVADETQTSIGSSQAVSGNTAMGEKEKVGSDDAEP